MNGKKIQRLRENRGLGIKEFADILGVDVKTVYNWEVGNTKKISKAHLKLIRETLF